MMRRVGQFIQDELCRWFGRSRKTARFLKYRIGVIFTFWVLAMAVLAIAKTINSPTPAGSPTAFFELLLPYVLATFAPVAGFMLAQASFPLGLANQQLGTRLSRWGKWRSLTKGEVASNRAYGPSGLVATILVGFLLSVAVRTLEFAVAVPSMSSAVPEWGRVIMLAMTFDLVVLNFFYMVCFSMAIRVVPLFPRMLVFTWLLDIQMQLAIANFVGAFATPESVGSALILLLNSNVQKVLISIIIWLPILILSQRINVTYRSREAV